VACQAQEPLEVAELTLLMAAVLGLVEGATEFLPVSSTGHLIVAEPLLGAPKNETFVVGIQAGGITAILVLYGGRLLAALRKLPRPAPGEPNLLLQIAVAALPAVVLGFLLDDFIDAHLFSTGVVAATTSLGGVLLLVLEAWLRARPERPQLELAATSYRTAFLVGLFQCLALIPGTSRSGATIAGGLLCGMSRPASAEISFLVGLPILYGAAALKLWKGWRDVGGDHLPAFLVGTAVSFVTALLVVRPFVKFLRAHTFVPFAIYRLVVGLLLAGLCAFGAL
jgi:undecaprenyl-diphosphatase